MPPSDAGASSAPRAARLLHHLPLAVSVAARHLAWDPLHGVLLGFRALPRGLRRRAATLRPLPTLQALALAAVGRRPAAARRLDEAARHARPARRGRLV
ncbi:hypothetical protein, partial [Angustibacter peucedani]